MSTRLRFSGKLHGLAFATLLTVVGGLSAPFTPLADAEVIAPQWASLAAAAPAATSTTATTNGAVELSPTPPNLTQAVAPNVVVTFDDSGSMASDFMGDNRPFDGKGWTGSSTTPWYCAGVIDPRITDTTKLASVAMNGVFYNPNVIYVPPVKADGTSMPNADATLTAVWTDGVTTNRPRSASASSTTNFTGTNSKNKDNRWLCPGERSTSPLTGGGPYYYRLKTGVDIGTIASPNTTALYTASNWEAVAVTNTAVVINGQSVNQYQNWANWYAYYRTRNLMTRTSLSRVFGALGNATSTGGFGSSIRVAWQNINDSNFKLPASSIITSLFDLNASTACDASTVDSKATQQSGKIKTPPNCYRSAFFNWIFQVAPGGTTPNRASTFRAGEFFKRGNGNVGATGDITDPYWQPPSDSGDGVELVCRQNFHMLVTDGYWNEGDPAIPSGTTVNQVQSSITLPDGTLYSSSAAVSRVYWDVPSYQTSLANIAFTYWSTNLRSDLYNPSTGRIVNPFVTDTTTGVITGAVPASEIYFNPANDPANWPHLVQYMVTLGVPGKLTYSNDGDCKINPNNDLCKLRKGQTNSTGTTGWPLPVNNAPQAIDDTWHAAVNSRGAYFNAGNPQNLVDQLTNILTNISARSAPAATSALNASVLTQGAISFSTGYSSSDWSGILQALTVNLDGTVAGLVWDAGVILSDATKTVPTNRQILTSKRNSDGSFGGGVAFRAGNFDTAGDTSIMTPASTGASDTEAARVDWLRGIRTLETSGVMRSRTSLLGAIINSQAVYVAFPASGYLNTWPTGSPEATAAASGSTYEQFVSDNLNRRAVVYVGANDGMLHAFDASETQDTSVPPKTIPTANAGHELFAYVPRGVYDGLGELTLKTGFAFGPTVDATPVTRDVFFSSGTNQGWHTILVGGLRLGGRGVYALDITDPTQVTEANAASKVLWEFNAASATSQTDPVANLGYTFGQPNIGRLANGKWVVLVPGGYFPDCSQPDKPINCPKAGFPSAANKYTSLYVLDAQTGALLRELKTPTTGGVVSYGLSSPVLGDYNNDQIDDVAFAGDLTGNLWRYDLSSSDPNAWTVTRLFKPATPGAQPITSMPRLFPDPATNRFIVVFGTGKYLGAGDNTSVGAVVQSVYGIRDISTDILKTSLVSQTLSEVTSDDGVNTARGLTDNPVPLVSGSGANIYGWYIDLNLTTAKGERVVVTPGALFDTNRALITTLIPGTNDPCSASILGAVMVINAATGGSGGGLSNPGVAAWSGSSPIRVVGGRVNNPPTGGSLPVAAGIGGGQLLIPGLSLVGGGGVSIDDAIWRRRSWRELLNDK